MIYGCHSAGNKGKSFHTERENRGNDPMAGMIKSNFAEHCESMII
jgi:hypothetical protein